MHRLLEPAHLGFCRPITRLFPSGAGLICLAVACSGCATQEHTTRSPYERTKLVQREILVHRGAVRFSARRQGSRVTVRLQNLELCRDSLLVTRGEEVTTHREVRASAERGLWIAFGSAAAASLVLAGASSSGCSSDADAGIACMDIAIAYLGAVAAATGAGVTGTVLGLNYLAAVDTSDEIQHSHLPEQRIRPCGQTPRSRARLEAVFGTVRTSAITDDDGEAELELGLPPGAAQDVGVHFSLDGSPIGVLPVSAAWRTALLRK